MRKLMVIVIAAVVIAGVGVVLGFTLFSPDDPADREPTAPQQAEAVDLGELDTTTMVVPRQSFCDRVPDEEVAAALGGEPQEASSYGNGERAAITSDLRDVAHEYACRWSGAGATSAEAWVFAPPVTPAAARGLNGEVGRGCRTVAGAPAFGSPSSAVLCGDALTFRGLFGDAWLTCRLTGEAGWARGAQQAEALDRAGRWCGAVASAASA